MNPYWKIDPEPIVKTDPDHLEAPAAGLFFWVVCSILLFFLHGIEEYFGGFTTDDPVWHWFYLTCMQWTTQSAAFLLFHFAFWFLLAVLLFSMRTYHKPITLLLVISWIMRLESYHLALAWMRHEYIGGMYTSGIMLVTSIVLQWAIARGNEQWQAVAPV